MSSILEIGNNKAKCQKFTPDTLVKTMLDLANYRKDLMGKAVLENSFGAGNFLKEIVIRYIKSGISAGADGTAISLGLARDIYGIELDKDLYQKCLSDLNGILRQYGIPAVKWKLFNADALTLDLNVHFDYVIGNPPYISYKEMDKKRRKLLKEKFESCSVGKFDYCYAFIESGLKRLKETGKLVQLIPNNIYKNVFAHKLRTLLADHISVIYDYPEQKLFDKTLTSVSIFLYDKENTSEKVLYKNITANSKTNIRRKNLGEKWSFLTSSIGNQPTIRFGDVFHAAISVATLCNEAFVLNDPHNEEALEQAIIKAAVSPKSLRAQQQKWIIFPYYYDDNKVLRRYNEEDFVRLFPNVSSHLRQYADALQARDNDDTAAWFEYGRSQALTHLRSEKLLVSTIITNSVEVYRLDADTIPYSGIYITVVDGNYNLGDAISILQSEHFLEYSKRIGVNISGKSVRITCKDINNYMFPRGR